MLPGASSEPSNLEMKPVSLWVVLLVAGCGDGAPEGAKAMNSEDAFKGLSCRMECERTAVAPSEPLRLTLNIRVEGSVGAGRVPDSLPHLLLPRVVDRNHLVKVVVTNRRNEPLEYRGPQPPGDIGDVEDLVLEPGRVISRSLEISRWFDFTPEGGPYRITVVVEPWSYETHFPVYWMGRLESNSIDLRVKGAGD